MENNNVTTTSLKDFLAEDTKFIPKSKEPQMVPRTPLPVVKSRIEELRTNFEAGLTRDLEWRRGQLKALLRMYEENLSEILEALFHDMRKSKLEAYLYEVDLMKQDVRNQINNLENWTRDELIARNFLTITDKAYITKVPYGVVLVIGAFNYPFQLTLVPVAGAIAAGNAVVIKPSEISHYTCQAIKKLIGKYLDPRGIMVFDGDGPETENLLNSTRFDYIFYTGSLRVGKLIHSYANKYLTPVTLELGGKAPVYLHDDLVDYKKTAERIIWGKAMNLGATCVAPDYVLCSKKVEERFVVECYKVLEEWYNGKDDKCGKRPREELLELYRNGKKMEGNPRWKRARDLARLVNTSHFDRLAGYLKEASGGKNRPRIALGGDHDRDDLWIEPTIIVDANLTSGLKMMEEEMFGPILPIMTVNSPDEAIGIINKYEHLRHPLCAYVFSEDREVQLEFQKRVRAGTMAMNDTIIQFAICELPFGGVGTSGMGSYHGKHSFDTFTHKKSVVARDFSQLGDQVGMFRYPPYTPAKINFLSFLLQHYKKFKIPSSETVSPEQDYGIVSRILLANPITMLCMWLVCDVFRIAGNDSDRKNGLGFKHDYIFLIFLKLVEIGLLIALGVFVTNYIFS